MDNVIYVNLRGEGHEDVVFYFTNFLRTSFLISGLFKNEFSLADGNAHFPWTQLQLPFNFKPGVAQLLDAHVANDASGFGKRSSLTW